MIHTCQLQKQDRAVPTPIGLRKEALSITLASVFGSCLQPLIEMRLCRSRASRVCGVQSEGEGEDVMLQRRSQKDPLVLVLKLRSLPDPKTGTSDFEETPYPMSAGAKAEILKPSAQIQTLVIGIRSFCLKTVQLSALPRLHGRLPTTAIWQRRYHRPEMPSSGLCSHRCPPHSGRRQHPAASTRLRLDPNDMLAPRLLPSNIRVGPGLQQQAPDFDLTLQRCHHRCAAVRVRQVWILRQLHAAWVRLGSV